MLSGSTGALCLGGELYFFWATEHLAQARGSRLSEKLGRVLWFCLTRRLGESFGVRRRAISPRREETRLSETSL